MAGVDLRQDGPGQVECRQTVRHLHYLIPLHPLRPFAKGHTTAPAAATTTAASYCSEPRQSEVERSRALPPTPLKNVNGQTDWRTVSGFSFNQCP